MPDVGLDADPTTGMLVGQTQTFPDGVYYDEYRIGGTSLASPAVRRDDGADPASTPAVGSGLLNPTIYAQAGSHAFTDIKGTPKDAGNVRVGLRQRRRPDGRHLLYTVRTFNQDSSPGRCQGLGRRHRHRLAERELADQYQRQLVGQTAGQRRPPGLPYVGPRPSRDREAYAILVGAAVFNTVVAR